MKFRSGNAAVITSLILICITIVLFFILTENRVMIDWLGLGFILAAELIAAYSIHIVQIKGDQQQFTLLGMYTVISLYTLISLGSSLLFLVFIRSGAKYLLTVQIILLVLYLIILAGMYKLGLHVDRTNAATQASINKMQELLNKVSMIQNLHGNGALRGKLDKLYDAIRYCDVSETVATDEIVSAKLTELQELASDGTEKQEAAEQLIENILVLMKQRTVEMKTIKAGGI